MDYYIAFDTNEAPTRIKAIRVRLDYEYISRNSERQLRVDLVDDPLYGALEAYVLANPSDGQHHHRKNGK